MYTDCVWSGFVGVERQVEQGGELHSDSGRANSDELSRLMAEI